MVNDIRRIYTDGREHMPEADRYPLWNGDSIGFWDGGKLVIHTNSLRAANISARSPSTREQVETVEIWEKVDDRTLLAHVWVYDPPSLARAVVLEAHLHEAHERRQEPAHPLLGLRREPEQHRDSNRRRLVAVPRLRFHGEDDN